MRIIGLIPEAIANAHYRVSLPIESLAARGHTTDVLHWDYYRGGGPPPMEVLQAADVVHIWRMYEAPVRRLAKTLQQAGVAIVWDNDDDLLQRPPSALPKNVSLAKEKTQDELAAMMRLADVVTVTCDELARRFRRVSGADVRVVENYVEAGFMRARSSDEHEEVVIGWVAAGEHRVDLKQLRLRPTLERTLRQHPHVHVVSVGMDLGLRSDRYHAHQSVPIAELPPIIAAFDLAIAPIADVSFNRTRSNIKLKEYAAGGAPWLASPIGPYRGMGEEQGGRLVKDPFWQQGLDELIVDDDARGRLRDQATAWARTQTMERNAEVWEDVFADAMKRARTRAGLPDVMPEVPPAAEPEESAVIPSVDERRGLFGRLAAGRSRRAAAAARRDH
jgi:hypothetical protein